MEQEIPQDSAAIQKALALGGSAGMIIVIGGLTTLAYAQGMRDPVRLVTGDVIMLIPLLLLCCVMAYAVRPRAAWSISEAGLTRANRNGERESIRWDQIYRMRNTTSSTLAIRWREDPPAPETDATAFGAERKDMLFIGQGAADKLISTWRRNTASPINNPPVT